MDQARRHAAVCARSAAQADAASAEVSFGFDQGAGGVAHEGAVLADVRVESLQCCRVAVDGEVGYPPDTFEKDLDDRADVEELHPAARRPQVHDS